jgi:hypothetical protein
MGAQGSGPSFDGFSDESYAEVVINFAAKRSQYLGGLGCIDGTTAAKTDNNIRIVFLKLIGDTEEIFAGTVRSRAFYYRGKLDVGGL